MTGLATQVVRLALPRRGFFHLRPLLKGGRGFNPRRRVLHRHGPGAHKKDSTIGQQGGDDRGMRFRHKCIRGGRWRVSLNDWVARGNTYDKKKGVDAIPIVPCLRCRNPWSLSGWLCES